MNSLMHANTHTCTLTRISGEDSSRVGGEGVPEWGTIWDISEGRLQRRGDPPESPPGGISTAHNPGVGGGRYDR